MTPVACKMKKNRKRQGRKRKGKKMKQNTKTEPKPGSFAAAYHLPGHFFFPSLVFIRRDGGAIQKRKKLKRSKGNRRRKTKKTTSGHQSFRRHTPSIRPCSFHFFLSTKYDLSSKEASFEQSTNRLLKIRKPRT
jgi:hypothetical protein